MAMGPKDCRREVGFSHLNWCESPDGQGQPEYDIMSLLSFQNTKLQVGGAGCDSGRDAPWKLFAAVQISCNLPLACKRHETQMCTAHLWSISAKLCEGKTAEVHFSFLIITQSVFGLCS